MFEFLKKKTSCVGVAYFRGSALARPNELTALREQGFELKLREGSTGKAWAIDASHATWGKASIIGKANFSSPSADMIDYASGLSDEERETFKQAGNAIAVTTTTSSRYVLRDRKNMLRYLGAILGDEGVGVVDNTSQKFWSPAALADELSHDADLSVSGILGLHLVIMDEDEETGEPVHWLHSHGLGEIGAADFDILRPHEDVLASRDPTEAIASQLLEGNVPLDGSGVVPVMSPDGVVRFVPAATFDAKASDDDAALRDPEEHTDNRVVVCDPVVGLFARFRNRPRPARFLVQALPEQGLFHYSNSATTLMSERAVKTYGMLRRFAEEFDELRAAGMPIIVKLGYEVDHAESATDREHLWFEVDKLLDDRVYATLLNEPFDIADMHEGDRNTHEITRLTDWMIPTPAGIINPRDTSPARIIRPRLAEMIADMKANQAGG